MSASLRLAAIGLDHRQIYGMSQGMMASGAEFAGWWTEGEPETLPGFVKRFPDTPRFETRQQLRNKTRCEPIDCKDAPLPYFDNLAFDVLNRTETACSQQHTFSVTELALQAQATAQMRGILAIDDE